MNNKCIWRQCLEPPVPHGPHKLDLNHDGYPVDFGTSVTYRCKPGYFFKHDRNQEEFQLECQDSGFFREPRPWPECIRGEKGCLVSEFYPILKAKNLWDTQKCT